MRALLDCCGSSRWAETVADARPFANLEDVIAASDCACSLLGRADWLEAFSAHPRIGAMVSHATTSVAASSSSGWSADEQAGVAAATRAALEERNREYEERFGHIFIVCATGLTGDEMLAMMERRMVNNRDAELKAAATEQRKITRLRLAKLLT
jgi:OHCU decarboxylase